MVLSAAMATADAHGIGFVAADPWLSRQMTDYVAERIVTLQGFTREKVKALLRDTFAGVAQETPFEIGTLVHEAIATMFDGFERWRADRIARTETAIAYNTGAIAALKQGGYTHVVVSDGQGENGCEACEAIDGQVWTLEEALANPTEHPNCVRSFSPATTEDIAAADLAEEGVA